MFPMTNSSEFGMEQYRNDNYREDASHFTVSYQGQNEVFEWTDICAYYKIGWTEKNVSLKQIV